MLFVAFLERRTWRQKELEARCELDGRAVRTKLREMRAAGVPLERDEDHPHVYWSVPKVWFPPHAFGSGRIDSGTVARLVARLPRSATRELVLAQLLGRDASASHDDDDVIADDVISALEDAASGRVALRLGYFTASRGEHGLRTISVQRIEYGDRVRVIAYCHASCALKWFRADRVTSPRLEPHVTFVEARPDDVERFARESLDGFRGSDSAEACELFARLPESRWIVRNLPLGAGRCVVAHETEGARIIVNTAALDVLARFVAGFGGAIRVVGPATLRTRVYALARGSLDAHREGKLNGGPARAIPPSEIARRARS